jgi:hypothetical protein
MELRILDRANGFEIKTVSINMSDIVFFGIAQKTRSMIKGGGFKKFIKKEYVQLANGELLYPLDDGIVKDLKKQLDGKYTTEKRVLEQFKKTKYGYAPRSAIEWTYKIK